MGLTLQANLKLDIVGSGGGIGQVGKGLGLLRGSLNKEGLEGLHGDNPG